MKLLINTAAVISLVCLTACSTDESATDTAISDAPAVGPVSQPSPEETVEQEPSEIFDTAFNIKILMNAMIQPNALELWQAVRYVATEDGVVEDVSPQTDEDWERLRIAAITLVEAGNALMIPGRVMDTGPLDADYPAFQYRPEEIQALVDNDPEGWRFYIQQMQLSTKATLEAIENQDLLGLIEIGARINNACQGCHIEYWYRPNNG